MRSAANSWALIDGPPSQSTTPLSNRPSGGGEVDLAPAGSDRAHGHWRCVLGCDDDAGSGREQRAREVELGRTGDHGDGEAGARRRTVSIGPHGARSHQHHVGGGPEGEQHREVGRRAERGRRAFDHGGTVGAGDHRAHHIGPVRRADVTAVELAHRDVIAPIGKEEPHGRKSWHDGGLGTADGASRTLRTKSRNVPPRAPTLETSRGSREVSRFRSPGGTQTSKRLTTASPCRSPGRVLR